jgi:histidinol-phosphatase
VAPGAALPAVAGVTVVASLPAWVADDERFLLAWDLLDRADELSAAAFRGGDFSVWTKDDGSPVTDVDIRIDRLLTEQVAAAFGGDAVLAEESGGAKDGTDMWIIDPLDGSANFVERVPVYAHMIARMRAGAAIFAMVSAPLLGRRWWAYRGRGAFQGAERISVSSTSEVDQARIAYGGLRDYDDASAAGLVRLIRRCRRSRGFGNFLPHMLVAEGTYDLASSGTGGQPWDVTPLALIVEEAGGRLTALGGRPWTESDPLLTSNTMLHDAALKIIASRGR